MVEGSSAAVLEPRAFGEPAPAEALQAKVVRESPALQKDKVRSDFIPKEAYLSPEFARREAQRLWPRIWQLACREEEIPREGDFITYDIVDDSIVVIRTRDGIAAYHNVCPHRGRPLVEGCGKARQFVCRFHGWRFNLKGENTHVVDRQDWGACLKDEDIHLRGVKVSRWGGFVFINMDPDSEPLEEFLSPFNHLCRKYEFEQMRFRWYRTVELPLNWKAMLEGFNEAYHVQTSHPQIIRNIEDYSNSGTFGIHSAFWYDPLPDGGTRFRPSSRLPKPESGAVDYRQHVLDYVKEMEEQLGAALTPRAYAAAKRMMTELPASATDTEVLVTWRRLWREAAEAEGAGWPDMGVEEIRAARQDWHIFPNSVFLLSGLDGLLAYRARPKGHDPDRCIFDVWSLMRYTPGTEPALKREYYTQWRDCDWGRILSQDFANLERVQQGMKSRAFVGARPNPHQEQAIANFHRYIWRVVGEG